MSSAIVVQEYYVVHEDDRWEVRLGPAGEVLFTHDYMRPAEREAERLARVFNRGLVVERQNGVVRYRRDASQV